MVNYIDKCKLLNDELFVNNEYNEDYINRYFWKDNYLKYLTRFENINEKQEKALEVLFTDDSEMIDRCQKAIDVNPTCCEAYYVLDYISDSLSFYYQTLDIQNTPIGNYEDEYELNDVLNIKMLISLYYISINNFHQALKYLKEVEKYIENDEVITHKLLIYNFLEDYNSMDEIYNNEPFNRPDQYIIYIVCLLKNDKRDLAKEIYEDMLDKYKYASYICKPQDLASIKNEESDEMMKAIEKCFDIIESIPFFFSWASDCIEDKNAPFN